MTNRGRIEKAGRALAEKRAEEAMEKVRAQVSKIVDDFKNEEPFPRCMPASVRLVALKAAADGNKAPRAVLNYFRDDITAGLMNAVAGEKFGVEPAVKGEDNPR